MSADALPLSPVARPRLRPLRLRGDDALRSLAAAGDADAFALLYERHRRALYRYCRSIVGHDEDARDVLHSTYANAWEALRRADREVPVRPWLFRIAHNEAVSLLRRRRAHADLSGHEDVEGSSLEQDVELRERLATLQADLAVLPERQRSALLLRELCGLRHAEIGEVFDVSPAAAKQSIYEARVGLNDAALGRAMPCAEVQRMLSDGDRRVARGRRVRGHLRSCAACRTFHRGLRRRPAELRALAPPLPLAAGAGLLARLLGLGGGSAAMTAGKLAGGVAVKAVLGTALLAGAGITTVAVEHQRHPSPRPDAARSVGHGSPGSAAAPAPGAAASASPLVTAAAAAAPRAHDRREAAIVIRPVAPAVRAPGAHARPGRAATGDPVAPRPAASAPGSPAGAGPAAPAASPAPSVRAPQHARPASPPPHAAPPEHARAHGARPSASGHPVHSARPAHPGHPAHQARPESPGRHGAPPPAPSGDAPGASAGPPRGHPSNPHGASKPPPAAPAAPAPDGGSGPAPGRPDVPPGHAGGGPPVGRGAH